MFLVVFVQTLFVCMYIYIYIYVYTKGYLSFGFRFGAGRPAPTMGRPCARLRFCHPSRFCIVWRIWSDECCVRLLLLDLVVSSG